METFEKDYQDILDELSVLKDVAPDRRLLSRIQHIASPERSSFPLFTPFRMGLAVTVLLLMTSGGIFLAASKPGEPLYQVKEKVENVLQTVIPEKQPDEITNEIKPPTPSAEKEGSESKNNKPHHTPTPSLEPSATPTLYVQNPEQPGQNQTAKEDTNKGLVIKEALGVSAAVSVSNDKTDNPSEEKKEEADNNPDGALPVQAQAEISLKGKPVLNLSL